MWRPAHLLAARLDGRAVAAVCEDERVLKVRLLATRLRVHAHEPQVLPQHVLEDVEVELHARREHQRVRHRADALALLDRGHVDLIVHVERADVLAVALEDIDELVDRAVLAKQHLCRMDLVLVQQLLHIGLRDVDELARGADADGAVLLALEVDVGRALVEPQPDHLQLALEQLALPLGFS